MRGLENMTKAHVLKCAAYNLGLLLRQVFSLGKPRSSGAVAAALLCLWRALERWLHWSESLWSLSQPVFALPPRISLRGMGSSKRAVL